MTTAATLDHPGALEGSAAKLDFGCGQKKSPGHVGMDIMPGEGVDMGHDFNVLSAKAIYYELEAIKPPAS